MRIHHRPTLDVEAVKKHYAEKDGVPIKYVCTSALGTENFSMDIFYRDTPHPEFGNRYFGLFVKNDYCWSSERVPKIINADSIEKIKFEMVEVDGQCHYSQHRHDFYTVGDISIDGGRAYLKRMGNLSHPVKTFWIKNGEFVEDNHF